MTPECSVVRVALDRRAYDVVVGPGLLDELGDRASASLGRTPERCAIITDDRVGPLYADRAARSLRAAGAEPCVLTVPAGEASKRLAVAEDLCRRMVGRKLDRGATIVALGGGVVGDLAGFVAAVFFRGIPFIQVPTTIVAQVDSSVGGKTGVNLPEGKNLVGAFHQPTLVLADVATLGSLPDREFREGFAEVVKHAAIRDASMLPDVVAASEAPRTSLGPLVARNIAIKARIVEDDERETTGTRALLNFGHTIGHAIESAAGYGRLLHGEAISLGIRAALDLSREIAGLDPAAATAVADALDRFGLPARLEDDLETAVILERMATDKKFSSGRIRFVLLRALGDAFVSRDVDLEAVRRSIERLRPAR